jgi:hypothetical protein
MFRKFYLPALTVAAGLTAAMLASVAPAMAQTVSTTETAYLGSAYGTQVNVASAVVSGRSALSTLGCTAQPGVMHTNTAASVSVPGVLSTGTVDTSTASEATPNGPLATSSATTQGVTALNGLVTATTVESASSTSQNATSGTFSTSAAGTQFTGLVVAGASISGTPAPNTKITLPSVGYVILNQQFSTIAKRHASLTVIAIHVYVTTATKTAKAGTQIIVSFASSGLGGPVSGLLDGLAYGAHANVGTTIIAGNQFPEQLSCLGTNGKTKTNTGAGLSVPGILTSGTVTDTAAGTDTGKHASAVITSTVQGLNLLTGTVQATLIKADVSAAGNPPTFGDTSTFTGLTVAGHPGITDNVPPNTKVSLAGLGTLWLHRQIKTASKITVIMVQLVVTNASNPEGLKVGTTVNVAYAQASVD